MSRDSHIWKNNLKLAQDRFFGVIFENTGSLDILLMCMAAKRVQNHSYWCIFNVDESGHVTLV